MNSFDRIRNASSGAARGDVGVSVSTRALVAGRARRRFTAVPAVGHASRRIWCAGSVRACAGRWRGAVAEPQRGRGRLRCPHAMRAAVRRGGPLLHGDHERVADAQLRPGVHRCQGDQDGGAVQGRVRRRGRQVLVDVWRHRDEQLRELPVDVLQRRGRRRMPAGVRVCRRTTPRQRLASSRLQWFTWFCWPRVQTGCWRRQHDSMTARPDKAAKSA